MNTVDLADLNAFTTGPPRLLVIDDEENVASTLGEILREEGFDVDVAVGGRAGLTRVRGTEFDVVLCDLRMDDVDGITILQEVRQRHPATVTILLTAFASLESAVAAMRHGAYDYLIKPCVIDDLKNTAKRGLERRRLAIEVEEARRQLEQANQELERRVEEKTAELLETNDDLRHANRAKDVFLATMSHELRTPLTPIMGWIRVLRAGNIAPEMLRQGLEVIDRNAQLQLDLIDDLLDVSRIVSGKLELELVPTNLRSVASNVLEGVRTEAAEKGVEIVERLGTEAVRVAGSELRLHQIVANLLSNAIKFTEGGGRVTVSLERGPESVRLAVSDTGRGIDPAFMSDLFNLFSQSRTHVERQQQQGMGIGLALARRLTELQGGTLDAESEGQGCGATFTLTLPIRDNTETPE